MTVICVAGGTGQVGREVVRQAVAAGHTVSVISRKMPSPGDTAYVDGARYFSADVAAGGGMVPALEGCAVVVDCLEGKTGRALKTYVEAGSRLLAAAEAAGVAKAVSVSIINCDQNGLAFYRSKAAKERVYARSGLETIVVRATQFHSLLAGIFVVGARLGIIPVVRGARFQTMSASEAATALLEAALEGPSDERHRLRTVGGPEVRSMRDLAESWRRHTGSRGLIVQFPLPGSVGRYLQEGRNLIPEQRFGQETFEGWLAKRKDTL